MNVRKTSPVRYFFFRPFAAFFLGKCCPQIHPVLQSVFTLPFLVRRFLMLIEIAMLFVQRFGQAGREQGLIFRKTVHDRCRMNRGGGCLYGIRR